MLLNLTMAKVHSRISEANLFTFNNKVQNKKAVQKAVGCTYTRISSRQNHILNSFLIKIIIV